MTIIVKNDTIFVSEYLNKKGEFKVTITTPKAFFGFDAGTEREMARWDKIVEYFYLLEKESDRIKVVNMGDSTEGNPFLQVVISSKENLENLDKIKADSAQIADPRGLSEEQMQELSKTGKAICVQSMSIHSHEIGGTQMSIKLAYELLSREDDVNSAILDNVVFVMVPCFNPDGQIRVTDFYYESKDTAFEGSDALPDPYHKYACHDNNRDAFPQNLIESQYMNKILYHEWNPQCYQDIHEMYDKAARIFVGYRKNPVDESVSPLMLRETMFYGSYMAYSLEKNDCPGSVVGSIYDGRINPGIHWNNANSHNIVGFLMEAAHPRIATSIHQYSEHLVGDDGEITKDNLPSIEMPSPWQGGEWGISETVRYMFHASYGLLDALAKTRSELISSRMKKALLQTKRGLTDDIRAYALPAYQHDQSALYRFVNMLLAQNVDAYIAKDEFVFDGRIFPKGSIIIPTSQPNYSVVKTVMGYDPKDVRRRNDPSCAIAQFMGLDFVELDNMPEGSFEKIESYDCAYDVPKSLGYILPGTDNNSYAVVNYLLKNGVPVFSTKNSSRDFYTEAHFEAICYAAKSYPVKVSKCEQKPDDMQKIIPAKAAVYKVHGQGDSGEAWARLLFDKFGFLCDDIRDFEIRDGKLSEYDILLIHDKDYKGLYNFDLYRHKVMDEKMRDNVPAPYTFALGGKACEMIDAFVKSGGRVLVFGRSCEFIINELNIPIDLAKDNSGFGGDNISVLRAKADTSHYLCYGMPEKFSILYQGEQVMGGADRLNYDRFSVPARFATGTIRRSGQFVDEALFGDKPIITTARTGMGEFILYGFQPHLRMQTDVTFKLLMNGMYFYE